MTIVRGERKDSRPAMGVAWDVTPLRAAGRPEIIVGPDEGRVIDAAVAALRGAMELYARGSQLVEVILEEPTTDGAIRSGPIARIARCAEARVRELLAREATWLGPNGGGGYKLIHPPEWAVRGVMARGQWRGIRPILAVGCAPTMRPDGSLLVDAGYDPSTAIYLAPSCRVAVADHPSIADARQAIDALLDLVCEFPASAAAKAAWVAGVLTAAVRSAIEGPAPMIIVDASVRGAGKSMMVDVAAIIVTGRPAARMIYSRDDAEMRKVITALALGGDPVVLLDNVVGELGCAALDAALTGNAWRDRVLGSSTMTAEMPLRITWWATGNGLVVGADLVRRALLVRLEPRCERPEERQGWRHPRLLDHVREHRATILGAALTIVRAFVVAGRPDQALRPMGSFEDWSDLVRGALVWAGAPDPYETVPDLRAASVGDDALQGIVEHWPAADGVALTANELLGLAASGTPWRAALTEWCQSRGLELPTALDLGRRLRSVKKRIVGGYMLDSAKKSAAGVQWHRIRLNGDL